MANFMQNTMVNANGTHKVLSTNQIARFLTDFGAKTGGDLSKIANFIGVKESVVSSWQRQKHSPIGLSRYKLLALFDVLGCPCETLSHMDKTAKALLKCISFNICTIEDVQAALSVPRDHVLRLVGGDRSPTGEILEYLEIFVDDRKEALETALQSDMVMELRSLAKSEPVKSHVLTVPRIPAIVEKPTEWGRDEYLIDVCAGLAKALEPIAERLASSAFTAEDRELLRSKMGRYTLFNLKNALTKLCGERARATISQELIDLGYKGAK